MNGSTDLEGGREDRKGRWDNRNGTGGKREWIETELSGQAIVG